MGLTYKIIEKDYNDRNIETYLVSKKKLSVEYTKVYRTGEVIDSKCMYFVPEDAVAMLKISNAGNYIMSEKAYKMLDETAVNGRNIIVVKTEEKLMFHILEECFLRYYKWRNGLVEIFLNQGTLPELLKITGEVIPDPIVITDTSFQILASSDVELEKDEEWLNIKQTGVHTSDFVQKFLGDEKFQKCVQYPNVYKYYLDTDLLDHANANCPICIKGELVAIASVVFCTNEVQQYEIDLLQEFSNYLRLFLSQKSVLITPNILENNIIKNFLLKTSTNDEWRGILTKEIEYQERDSLYVVILCTNEKRKSDMLLMSRIVDELTTAGRLEGCFIVRIHDTIAILCNHSKNKIPKEEIFGIDMVLLKNSSVCIGISNMSDSIEALPDLYSQAMDALKIGKQIDPDKSWFCFSDYIWLSILDKYKDKTELIAMLHPLVKDLRAKRNETDIMLLDTLVTYVLCDFNINEMSRKIYVHKNTIYYRLKKIEEQYGVDLSQEKTRRELLMSTYILLSIDGQLNP